MVRDGYVKGRGVRVYFVVLLECRHFLPLTPIDTRDRGPPRRRSGTGGKRRAPMTRLYWESPGPKTTL